MSGLAIKVLFQPMIVGAAFLLQKELAFRNQQTLQLGVNEPVTDKVDKERLYRTHKAHAVDMESHIIGTYAQKRNIPFLILFSSRYFRYSKFQRLHSPTWTKWEGHSI